MLFFPPVSSLGENVPGQQTVNPRPLPGLCPGLFIHIIGPKVFVTRTGYIGYRGSCSSCSESVYTKYRSDGFSNL